MANNESSSQLSEDELEDGPLPQLILPRNMAKVGDHVMLDLRNISPEQDVKVTIEPDLMCDMHEDPKPSETTIRYKLVPKRYGVCRVTIKIENESTSSLDPLKECLRVQPMGKLDKRVTGHPQNVQLPRDVLVDNMHLIISDGIRRKVIRMRKDGTEQEVYTVPPCENFSPIGLAMKKDECEENNELYVTDLNNACVHIFHGPKKYLESFGKDVLKRPTGIAIDDDGYIFVADHEAKRIFQFTPDYEPVMEESPHELAGPQLMTIHQNSLLVADRRGSKISVFSILHQSEQDVVKELIHITDHNITVGAGCNYVMPFSVACDPDGHIFIAGQVSMTNTDQKEEKKGFIWFKDIHSSLFDGINVVDWPFGDGLRNPGGMRIVEEGGRKYLYVTDMRGKNANNCINKYLL